MTILRALNVHLPADYDDIGKKYADHLLKARRSSLVMITAAILNGWTDAEIDLFIETGEQPAGKAFSD